jgi:spermidine/putrescine transport system substrate-binding protein
MQRDSRISRGRFLKVMGAAGVAGSTLSILACQPNTTPQQGGGGDGSGEKVLNYFNWADYVAEDTIPNFEKEFGVKVNQSFFASPDELLAKVQTTGGSQYDVIFPGNTTAEIMIKEQLLKKLDMSKIPNFDNIGEEYKGLPFDPSNKYTIPYTWGTTGILYNKEVVGEIDSWEAMWDPDYGGKIAMLDDMRETVGAALMLLGYSVNATEPRKLEEAKQKLLEQKPLVRAYLDNIRMREQVVQGNIVLGHNYSGDAYLVTLEDERLDYVIPKEGGTQWVDNIAIPARAPHPEIAHEFINYILRPEVGADISNQTLFASPNKAALPMVDEKLKNSTIIYPPPETFERLQVTEDVGKTTREYTSEFTAVQSA